MSSTAAVADAPAPKGKKKLILIVVAALVVVLLGGGAAALLMMKKNTQAEDEGDGEARTPPKAEAKAKRDSKAPPAYVPLDMFVVNLADREAERYAQIGITLELTDAKDADAIKTFLPAIRNNILMVLAHKTSAELLGQEGKTKLSGEIQRTVSRALGVDAPEPDDDSADEDKPKPKKKKKKAAPAVVLPIHAVHFSNFIVQ